MEKVSIGELVQKIQKWDPRKAENNSTLTYIDISSVSQVNKEIIGYQSMLNHEAPSRARQLLESGDVLVSTVRPNLNAVAYVTNDYDKATASTGFCVLRANKKMLHDRYLYYWLRNPHFVYDMTKQATGQSYPAVSDKVIKESKIPLPPLDHQKYIASILDKASAVIRKRQQAIELSEQLVRSVFLEMFGDPSTNNKNWQLKKLGSLISDVCGGVSIKPEEFTEDGFPVLHKGGIKPGGVIELDKNKKTFTSVEFANKNKRAVVNKEFVAVTTRDLVPSGPSIGLMTNLQRIPQAEFLLSQGTYAFRIKDSMLNPDYLVWLSNIPSFRAQFKRISVGSTQIHIRISELVEMLIPVPPIDLQNRFQSVLINIYKLQLKALEFKKESEDLFNSLSQKAFRGELH